MPQNHWQADTPSYKIKATVNGDKGTLYFECHYIDIEDEQGHGGGRRRPQGAEDQRQVADHRLVRSADRRSSRTTGELMAQPGGARGAARRPAVGGARRLGQPPRARASRVRRRTCARSCSSRSSAIAALLVLVGVLGLRFLGQANARVERLGDAAARSSTYDALQTQASMLRQLLGFRDGGDPGPATVTGAKSSFGGRRWALVDREIRFGALRSSGRRRARRPTASCRRRRDERMLRADPARLPQVRRRDDDRPRARQRRRHEPSSRRPLAERGHGRPGPLPEPRTILAERTSNETTRA